MIKNENGTREKSEAWERDDGQRIMKNIEYMRHAQNSKDEITEWVSDITIKQNVSFYITAECSNPYVHWDIQPNLFSYTIQYTKRHAVKDTL